MVLGRLDFLPIKKLSVEFLKSLQNPLTRQKISVILSKLTIGNSCLNIWLLDTQIYNYSFFYATKSSQKNNRTRVYKFSKHS